MVNFGPADESTQEFDEWVVSSTHPELFSAKPKILPVDGVFGQLAFTPADNANGTSTVTIRGRDGASASDGGDDLSDPIKFKITITVVDDPASPGADDRDAIEPADARGHRRPVGGPDHAGALRRVHARHPGAAGEPAGGGGPPTTIVVVILAIVLVGLVAGVIATLYLPKWRAKRGA